MGVQSVALFVLYKTPLAVMARGFFMLTCLRALGVRGMALPLKPASRQKMAIYMSNIGYLDF